MPLPSDPAPRPRDAEGTRRALLEAATRRFTVLGYARTTTRDVAADAGVNVALISRYFGSKAGLLEAVLTESADLVRALPSRTTEELVDGFLDGFRGGALAGAGPDLGDEHPLRLLLRDASGDDRLRTLRTRALTTAVDTIAASETPGPTDPADQSSRLRADLLLALLAGTTALRPLLPDEPLATVPDETLRAELLRVARAITARG